MSLPILYSYRRCPYAMRARMALKLAAIEVEIREISLRDKPLHMLQVSPKGTVPVLVLVDGMVIEESLAIMHWCMEQAAIKQTAFKHESQHDVIQINVYEGCRALISMNDTNFKRNLDAYKYPERNLKYGSQQGLQYDLKFNLQPNLPLKHAKLNLQTQLKYRTQAEVFLAHLETLLEANIYLLASTPSFADIAIFPFIRQFAMVDSVWFEHCNYLKLRAWLYDWTGSSLFKSIMTKNPTFVG